MPGTGGSDHSSFVQKGIPAFGLSSTSWDYGKVTWHTNRDTYDKIVFDEVKLNAIIVAILTYLACEEPELVSREKIVLPMDKTGKQMEWPTNLQSKRQVVINGLLNRLFLITQRRQSEKKGAFV